MEPRPEIKGPASARRPRALVRLGDGLEAAKRLITARLGSAGATVRPQPAPPLVPREATPRVITNPRV